MNEAGQPVERRGTASKGPLEATGVNRASPRSRLQPLAYLLATLAFMGCAERAPGPGHFRIAVPYDLASLDPHAEFTTGHFSLLDNVYEGLVRIERDLTVRPRLAEYWETPDPLTWVFHLRPATFHDGRPVTAADVVYSFRRLLDRPELDVGYYVLNVKQVRSLDPSTLVIKTRRPSSLLLNRLSWVYVVPQGAFEEGQDALGGGTGPYRIVRWQPGRELSLERHRGYWGPKPLLEGVVFAVNRRPEDAVRGLRSGRYQMIALGPGDSQQPLDSAAHRLLSIDSPAVLYLGLNLRRPNAPLAKARPNPFLRREVRRAIHLAIDRNQLVTALPGRHPANQLVPREVFGFDPSLPQPVTDRAAARQLLSKAGLGRGFAATLHTRPSLADTATLVGEQLAAVGIRLEVEVLPEWEYFRALEQGQFSMWLDRWGCTTGDAGELFEGAMHSRDAGRRLGLFNESGYSNAGLDRAIEESVGLDRPLPRQAALQAIMRTLMEELVWIPLHTESDRFGLERCFEWQPRFDLAIRAAEIRLAQDANATCRHRVALTGP
jgi:peptide/nickel transport system substrate-binding protein